MRTFFNRTVLRKMGEFALYKNFGVISKKIPDFSRFSQVFPELKFIPRLFQVFQSPVNPVYISLLSTLLSKTGKVDKKFLKPLHEISYLNNEF